LDIVELKFTEGDKSVYTFLHSVLAQPFPDPGQTIQAQTFQTILRDDGTVDYLPETFRLTRSNDDYEYLEYTTYEKLFRSLDVDKIMLIFECLLNERRILLVANTLSTLTSCMDAVSNMAYPFSWQYVFVPILPTTMMAFLGAPMPFLIGILSASLENAMKEPMEDGVLIVDIDNNEVLQAPDDLPDTMPLSATEKLRKSLKAAVMSEKRNMEFSIDVAHCLLKFWASIFGTYSKYFEPVSSGEAASGSATSNSPGTNLATTSAIPQVPTDYCFNFDRFIKSKSAEAKKFLSSFKDYQLYQYFIQERESWLKKGLLSYCIILRAQNAKKKDSMAAVKAKFKARVGKVLAAWNEGYASTAQASHAKRKGTLQASSDHTASDQSPLASMDDTTSNSDTLDSTQPDTTTESDEKMASSETHSSSPSTAKKDQVDRPRAATAAPALPPKPSKSSKPSKPSKPSSSAFKEGKSSIVVKDSKGVASTASSPSLVAVDPHSEVVISKPTPVLQFVTRYTFKPSPLIEVQFDKQIWKMCNSEAFGDVQIASSEKRKYWAYSPLVFTRLPSLAVDISSPAQAQAQAQAQATQGDPRSKSSPSSSVPIITLPLGDDSVESLLQWIFSDEIFIESAESALELLSFVSSSNSKGSSFTHLKTAISNSIYSRMNNENVFNYLKVFAGPKADQSDSTIEAILACAKLRISNFTSEEMTPLVRRQISSTSYLALASIMNIRSSASARLEAQSMVERIIPKIDTSGPQVTPRTLAAAPRKHLLRDLTKLLDSQKYFDVTLVFPAGKPTSKESSPSKSSGTDDGSTDLTIKAHSKILAARSPHLAKMLNLNLGDHVKILNVSFSAFSQLLPYIYTGQLQDVKDDRTLVFELVQAAHILELDSSSFREALFAALSSTFTTSSVFEFLDAPPPKDGSLQHPAERAILVGAAAYYIAHHSTIFYRPDRLKNLEPDVWECILKFSFATDQPKTDQRSSSSAKAADTISPQVSPRTSSEKEKSSTKASEAPAPPPKKKKANM
jgi:hypothetical protein